mgnify:CR=1 FL=1
MVKQDRSQKQLADNFGFEKATTTQREQELTRTCKDYLEQLQTVQEDRQSVKADISSLAAKVQAIEENRKVSEQLVQVMSSTVQLLTAEISKQSKQFGTLQQNQARSEEYLSLYDQKTTGQSRGCI